MFKSYINGLRTEKAKAGQIEFDGTIIRAAANDIFVRGSYHFEHTGGSFELRKHPLTNFEYDMARSTYHDLVDLMEKNNEE